MPEQDWKIEEQMAEKSSVVHHSLQALSPAYSSQAEDSFFFQNLLSKGYMQCSPWIWITKSPVCPIFLAAHAPDHEEKTSWFSAEMKIEGERWGKRKKKRRKC